MISTSKIKLYHHYTCHKFDIFSSGTFTQTSLHISILYISIHIHIYIIHIFILCSWYRNLYHALRHVFLWAYTYTYHANVSIHFQLHYTTHIVTPYSAVHLNLTHFFHIFIIYSNYLKHHHTLINNYVCILTLGISLDSHHDTMSTFVYLGTFSSSPHFRYAEYVHINLTPIQSYTYHSNTLHIPLPYHTHLFSNLI